MPHGIGIESAGHRDGQSCSQFAPSSERGGWWEWLVEKVMGQPQLWKSLFDEDLKKLEAGSGRGVNTALLLRQRDFTSVLFNLKVQHGRNSCRKTSDRQGRKPRPRRLRSSAIRTRLRLRRRLRRPIWRRHRERKESNRPESGRLRSGGLSGRSNASPEASPRFASSVPTSLRRLRLCRVRARSGNATSKNPVRHSTAMRALEPLLSL